MFLDANAVRHAERLFLREYRSSGNIPSAQHNSSTGDIPGSSRSSCPACIFVSWMQKISASASLKKSRNPFWDAKPGFR